MALSDLLSGRSVDDMLESLPRLWELCFRARDDIKVNVLPRFQPRSQGYRTAPWKRGYFVSRRLCVSKFLVISDYY